MASNKSKNLNNTAKLAYAAQHLMPAVLQELLRINEPCHVIVGHVRNDRNLWSSLFKTERAIILKAATEGYTHFDTPLIYKILRSLNTVDPPTKGWRHQEDPESSETSVGDDVERIVRYTNEIAHTIVWNCKVTDIELTKWLSAFKDVSKRMEVYLGTSNGHFTHKLENLEMLALNDDMKDSILSTVRCLKEDVGKLKQEIGNSNINDAIVVQIEEWEKIDEKFVPTGLCAKLVHNLKENNVTTVYGISGIGKSATIHHVALLLRKQSQYEIIPCHSPEDIERNFRKNENQVFVFDDVCGRYSAIQNEVNSWLKYEPVLKSIIREGNTKIIASCRTQVFEEEQFQRIGFLTECSIEFTNNLLTKNQKRSIAERYLDPNLIRAIENVINTNDFLPLMCSLYRNHTEKDVVEFFENTFDIYMSEFENMKEEPNKLKYFAILLIVLCNGELCFPVKENNISHFYQCFPVKGNNGNNAARHDINIQNLLEDFGISGGAHKTDILMQLDSLVGTFLKTEYYHNKVGKEMVIYRPMHAKLFDYMCHHCGLQQNFQNLIIKYACRSLLNQQTCIESLAAKSEERPIVITTENEEEFFCRMIRDILEVKSDEVFRSSQMQCPEYRQKLISFLNCNADLLKASFDDIKIGRKVLRGILASNYSDVIAVVVNIAGSLVSVSDRAYCIDKSVIGMLRKTSRNVNVASIKIRKHHYTPLVCACFHGHTEIVKLLLSEGTSVNCNVSHRKLTPLLAAIIGNNTDVVEKLLENDDIDVNLSDSSHVSPLVVACNTGNFPVVCSLVERGAVLDAIDKCGQTALMFASRQGYFDIVQFLCERGAYINAQSRKRWTALMFACKGGHTNIVGYLIERGSSVADINVKTQLTTATKQHSIELFKCLLEKDTVLDLNDLDEVSVKERFERENTTTTVASLDLEVQLFNDVDDTENFETVGLRLGEEIDLNVDSYA
ncbi:uncharacterized protein LOC134695684 [Mytilus trossulus]|uniref:uncharacterized protein LOC134695684 n=1 Tax=Mytilus trossulus TaxID=6551 RepID=UPI003006753D